MCNASFGDISSIFKDFIRFSAFEVLFRFSEFSIFSDNFSLNVKFLFFEFLCKLSNINFDLLTTAIGMPESLAT